MSRRDYSDAALVLLGHGTALHAGSAAPAVQHAAELRRRRLFAEVREAFWKQTPQVSQVLTEISARRVFIIPLFISEGYFSDEIIPRELGFEATSEEASQQGAYLTLRRGGQTFHYCEPVGTHDSMLCVLLARAAEVVVKAPHPRAPRLADTTLFIAGHGTDRNGNSRRTIERQAARVRGLGQYAAVHGVFLEEEPRIADCYALAQTRNVVVVPFFISDGLHTLKDIPLLLGESRKVVGQRLAAGQPPWRNPTERQGKRVWYARAVGTEPHLAEVILERVREAHESEAHSRSTP